MQHWKAIVLEAKYVVKTKTNQYSFEIWYHKALAECSVGLVEQCEDSIKHVEMYSGNKAHRMYAQSLYNYLLEVKKKGGGVSNQVNY